MDTTQLIQALREFSTTELCDGMTEFRVLDPAIHGMAARRKIVGPVFPVEIPGGGVGLYRMFCWRSAQVKYWS